MLRQISIFSGAEDLTLALGLLWRTAAGLPRTSDNAMPLEALADAFGGADAMQTLGRLAERLDLTVELPPGDDIRQLFADELLSSKALRLHRGRNVYSGGKAALWSALWLPFRDALTIDDETRALTEELVALRTARSGAGVAPCVRLLVGRLEALGFSVSVVEAPGHAPIIRGHRPARGAPGRIAMYAHYDVEEPAADDWRTDPWALTEHGGRLYGVGVGDNKAALAHRLVLLGRIERTPELLWVIQGEEEIGSPLAHHHMAWLLDDFAADLWLEENGYFDPDGTQRILARVIGAATAAEPSLDALIGGLSAEAARFGRLSRVERRGLNKSFFPEGCPFDRALPDGARYLAIGVNDPASGIHRPNESVPMWTFPVHARQFERVMAGGWMA